MTKGFDVLCNYSSSGHVWRGNQQECLSLFVKMYVATQSGEALDRFKTEKNM